MNLIDSYLAVVCGSGEPIRHAVETINASLGTRYSYSRLWEWRRGDRPIPRPVHDLMLRTVLEQAIRAEGGAAPRADQAIDRLARRLSPPERRV